MFYFINRRRSINEIYYAIDKLSSDKEDKPC